MKFLLFLIAVVVLLWMLRSSWRRARGAPPARKPAPPDAAQPLLLTCAQCGLHLPLGEALPGRGGVFCSDAHRAAYEQAHPGT